MTNTPKEMWNLDVARAQISAMPFFAPMRAHLARQFELPTYEDYCDRHGVTDFQSRSARCVLCVADDPKRTRAEARALGVSRYLFECPVHGETDHDVPRGKCLTCFTTLGAPRTSGAGRPVTSSPRALARREGRKEFPGTCETHGETPHSVAHGRCLACFNSVGVMRPGARAALDASVKPA